MRKTRSQGTLSDSQLDRSSNARQSCSSTPQNSRAATQQDRRRMRSRRCCASTHVPARGAAWGLPPQSSSLPAWPSRSAAGGPSPSGPGAASASRAAARARTPAAAASCRGPRGCVWLGSGTRQASGTPCWPQISFPGWMCGEEGFFFGAGRASPDASRAP